MRKITLVVVACTLPGICLALALSAPTEAQALFRKKNDLPAIAIPKRYRPAGLAEAVHDLKRLEAAYSSAVESNQNNPGTVAADEVDRLHRVYSDLLISVTSKQVTLLQAEVDELRKEIQDIKSVKIRPLAQ